MSTHTKRSCQLFTYITIEILEGRGPLHWVELWSEVSNAQGNLTLRQLNQTTKSNVLATRGTLRLFKIFFTLHVLNLTASVSNKMIVLLSWYWYCSETMKCSSGQNCMHFEQSIYYYIILSISKFQSSEHGAETLNQDFYDFFTCILFVFVRHCSKHCGGCLIKLFSQV